MVPGQGPGATTRQPLGNVRRLVDLDRVDRDRLGALKIVEALNSPAFAYLRFRVR